MALGSLAPPSGTQRVPEMSKVFEICLVAPELKYSSVKLLS